MPAQPCQTIIIVSDRDRVKSLIDIDIRSKKVFGQFAGKIQSIQGDRLNEV